MNFRLTPLLALCLFLIYSLPLLSQDRFEQTSGPYGGNISSAAVASDGTVYVVTGNNEVVRSDNNGASWVRCQPRGVHRVAVDSSGNVYAGFDFGVYHSSDRGESWTRHQAGVPVPSLNLFTQVYLLEAGTNGTVYLGYDSLLYRSTDRGATWSQVAVRADKPLVRDISVGASGIVHAGIDGGAYRSIDQGATWSRLDLPIALTDTVVVLDAAHGGEMWARVAPQLVLYHSTDGGDTWTPKNSMGLPSNTAMLDLALSESGVLFAGMETGLYRSTNRGENWRATGGEGIERNAVSAVVVGGEGVVFAGASDLYRSTDGGSVWSTSTAGMIATAVFALEQGIGDRILAGTINNLFRSDNGGTTWSESRDGIPLNTRISDLLRSGGVLIATTRGGGIFRSTDNGIRWTAANMGLSSSIIHRIIFTDNGSLLVATRDGVFRSTAEAGGWVASSTGLPGQPVRDITNAGNGEIFAATSGSGVFASSDHGATWTSRNAGITDAQVNAILATPRGTLFAGTEHEGIFRSTNRGMTWTRVTFDVAISHVAELAVDPAGSIYVATHFPVRSTDNGNTWSEQIHIPFLTNTHTRSHLAASDGSFYFGTDGAGVAKIVPDNGSRWEILLAAPAGTRTMVGSVAPSALVGPTSFAFSPAPLYAATANGVFRSLDKGISWISIADGAGLSGITSLLDYRNGQRLFAGTSSGVSVYMPESNLWSSRNEGLPAGGVSAMIADNPAERIYAATRSGVYAFGSGGPWRAVREGMGEREITDLLLTHDGGLLAVDASGALYRAPVAGGIWSPVGGIDGKILSLAADPSGRIYAGTEQGGLYRSTDDGRLWQVVPASLQGKSIVSLAVTSHGTVVAGTDEGIWRSIDGGSTWSFIDATGSLAVSHLMVSGDGRMFVASESGALYRSIAVDGTSGVVGVEQRAGELNIRLAGGGAAGRVALHYTLPLAEDVRIELFDARGNPMRELFTGRIAAGAHTVSVETSGLAAGAYFCRIVAGARIASCPLIVLR